MEERKRKISSSVDRGGLLSGGGEFSKRLQEVVVTGRAVSVRDLRAGELHGPGDHPFTIEPYPFAGAALTNHGLPPVVGFFQEPRCLAQE